MRLSRILFALILAYPVGTLLFFWLMREPPLEPPYAPSRVITDVKFDFRSMRRHAIGSDNFPVTWGADDHQYAIWGDGAGFQDSGRQSLGVARIEGAFPDHRGVDVFGGPGAENPAQFDGRSFNGKSYGLVDIDGKLYMWVSPLSDANNFKEARLAYSFDRSRTWTLADWAFTQEDGMVIPTICQFGRGYSGARDTYVYSYFIRLQSASKLQIQKPGQIDLLRVPKERFLVRETYEFFAGLDGNGEPRWSTRLEDRRPVFEDPNGVGWNLSVSYNPGLRRYFLSTEHGRSFESKLGVFEAPEPWGPWRTVAYFDDWGGFGRRGGRFFFWNFSNKWLSEDGKSFVLVASGCCDMEFSQGFNTVPGRFVLAED